MYVLSNYNYHGLQLMSPYLTFVSLDASSERKRNI